MKVETYNCAVCGQAFTAKDALNDINPADVQSAVNKYKQTVEDSIKRIADGLTNAKPDAENAVRTKSLSVGPMIDDTVSQINSAGTGMASAFDDLPGKAQAKWEELQQGYNGEAQAAAAACAASHPEPSGTNG